ncbi:hypothetical protein BDZ94DRAFT_1271283 [Collybia nuda]|uniref:Uncharacterized protein n=1 Tax=Collybia nuda TaxID=64659 RepID=A0A9P5XX59_9AGAR|nr:hypothetical protein BDZ94DRAFT_1271283 [Collybia nuda]
MVGRLTINGKVSGPRESSEIGNPPPPYDSKPNSPIILAGTTTTRTEVVTTTTTTHFFSLPLWRKRGPSPSGPVAQNALSLGAGYDEHGILHSSARTSAYHIEKDLPPTPALNEPELLSDVHQHFDRLQSEGNDTKTNRLPVPPIHVDSQKYSDMQSTAALARAALGLGLPHVLPHSSGYSPQSEINTIAFASQTLPDNSLSPPRIRRVKSSQKFKSYAPPDRSDTVVSPEQGFHRRSRGFSLGTNSFLDLGPPTKGKGKEKDTSEQQPSSKSISRRSSFWSRRRTATPDLALFPTCEDATKRFLIPLPTLPPVSPLQLDLASIQPPISSPLNPQSSNRQHIRGLSRSHSEYIPSTSTNLSPEPNQILATPDIPDIIIHPQHSRSTYSRTERSNPLSTFRSSIPPRSEPSGPSRPPPRPRAHTNPTLSSRISFDATPSSVKFFSRNSLGESTSVFGNHATQFPENHLINIASPLMETESPEIYLQRLRATVSKAEVAGILASSIDPFHVKALKTYVGRFNFVDDPLDVALRKLLMEVGLPRETQQIDRVMEAFAARYLQCNPTLFTSEDHPYILAFSLIMLHTDAFNKSNKRKMTKADYVKNTRLPGVSLEMLDCFYDNILFAPFIFIEDPLDVNGQHGLATEATAPLRTMSPSGNLLGNSISGGQPITRGTKLDPYYLIANNLLHPLRVNVEAYVPTINPYSYEGTGGPWDETVLQRAFAKANEIEVGTANYHRAPLLLSAAVGDEFTNPSGGLRAHSSTALPAVGQGWTLKVTKVGLLNRKDDILEGGKKASNRKWKTWSVILTGSQLLFFRDSTSSISLLGQMESTDGRVINPQSSIFKPDELVSVKGAVAVFDKSYTKYENTFRFALSDGRQLLLQTSNEKDLNEWISIINYASAFKSAGVRMRPIDMSGMDVKLTGVAAATSHLHDLQYRSSKAHNWDCDAPQDLMDMLSGDLPIGIKRSPHIKELPVGASKDDTDIDIPVAPEVDGADQFKATFDQVKADLAAGRWSLLDDDVDLNTVPHTSTQLQHSSFPSRSRIMRSKILDLESKINTVQSQLEADMRFVRNIAILTPFQKSTRDRLVVAVQGIAKRIMQVRLENTKLVCHRYVLLSDLASQERSWHRAKIIALRAATETLQIRSSGIIPRKTFSCHNEPSAITLPISLPHLSTTLNPSYRPESSVCDSFHSAMDFGSEWPSPEDLSSSSFLHTSYFSDSPERSNSRPPSPIAHLNNTETGHPRPISNRSSSQHVQNHTSSRTSDGCSSFEKASSTHEILEEQAELWNETRCAHRVSLVKLPSDMQISTRIERFTAQRSHP